MRSGPTLSQHSTFILVLTYLFSLVKRLCHGSFSTQITTHFLAIIAPRYPTHSFLSSLLKTYSLFPKYPISSSPQPPCVCVQGSAKQTQVPFQSAVSVCHWRKTDFGKRILSSPARHATRHRPKIHSDSSISAPHAIVPPTSYFLPCKLGSLFPADFISDDVSKGEVCGVLVAIMGC